MRTFVNAPLSGANGKFNLALRLDIRFVSSILNTWEGGMVNSTCLFVTPSCLCLFSFGQYKLKKWR